MSSEEEPKEPLFSEDLTRRLQSCLRCSECNLHCPVYRALQFNEAYSPRGWVNLASMLALREVPVFIDKIEHMYISVLCGRCDPPCPYDVKPSELILRTRKELIDLGYVPPLEVAALPRKIRTNLPLFEPAAQEGAWSPPGEESGSAILYLGRWVLNSPETAVAASELAMRWLSVPPLADSRPSCGEVLRLAGYFDEAREELESLVETFRDRRVERIITACPEAASRLSEAGLSAKTLHESLSDADVVDGKAASRKFSRGVLLVPDCWHDGANEALFQTLSEVNVSVVYSDICASCGYLVTYNARPDVIERLGREIISQAEREGMAYVAFVHPAAYSAVKAALRGAKVKPKILDAFQLLLQVARKA